MDSWVVVVSSISFKGLMVASMLVACCVVVFEVVLLVLLVLWTRIRSSWLSCYSVSIFEMRILWLMNDTKADV